MKIVKILAALALPPLCGCFLLLWLGRSLSGDTSIAPLFYLWLSGWPLLAGAVCGWQSERPFRGAVLCGAAVILTLLAALICLLPHFLPPLGYLLLALAVLTLSLGGALLGASLKRARQLWRRDKGSDEDLQ